jgi:hypothetical protein
VMLRKRQRNDIFETLVANGVAPEGCELLDLANDPLSLPGQGVTIQADERWRSERYSNCDSVIFHARSKSAFQFWPDNSPNERYLACLVVGAAESGSCSSCTWDQILDAIAEWAREVRYEMDTPDLWAELTRLPEILTAVQGAEAVNAPFTQAEQAEISTRLDVIKEYVSERFELTAAQMSAIEQGLDQVNEASTRVGRKDWMVMVNGTLLSLITSEMVPPHVIQSVFHILIAGIGHIFGVGGPPPVITI